MNLSKIPEKYHSDIEKAVFCLKAEGCTSVFLFGSLINGKYNDSSDIDLGIKGLSPQKYIRTYSKLNNILKSNFDLIDFDENIDLYNLLYSIGEIVEIGNDN
jgi:predicted nucleotidyltransferase